MKLLKIFTNNWQIKLLAIIAASLLWAYASSVKTSVKEFPADIPISAINLTPGYVAILEKESVSISISADSGVWSKLSTNSFSAYVDLAGLAPGTHSVAVNVGSQVAGVSIVSKNPAVMSVTIEPAVEKDLTIVPKIDGNAAEGLIAGSVTFSPALAKVSGPKSIVDGVNEATAEIVLSGEPQSFTKNVNLVALDNKGNLIKNLTFIPKSVNANVTIVPAGNVKNVGIKVATRGILAAGYSISSITSNPSSVAVYGSAEVLRGLNSVSTQAIDISGLSKNLTTKVNLALPVGIQVDGLPEVTVAISVTQSQNSRIFTLPVKTKNLGSGLRISSIIPENVEVTVGGSAESLAALSSNNISLVIDLSGLSAGQNVIQLKTSFLTAPAGISLESFGVNTVTITLE